MTKVLHSELPRLLGGCSRAWAGELAKRPDFPKPVEFTVGGEPLWDEAEVLLWERVRTTNLKKETKG